MSQSQFKQFNSRDALPDGFQDGDSFPILPGGFPESVDSGAAANMPYWVRACYEPYVDWRDGKLHLAYVRGNDGETRMRPDVLEATTAGRITPIPANVLDGAKYEAQQLAEQIAAQQQLSDAVRRGDEADLARREGEAARELESMKTSIFGRHGISPDGPSAR